MTKANYRKKKRVEMLSDKNKASCVRVSMHMCVCVLVIIF